MSHRTRIATLLALIASGCGGGGSDLAGQCMFGPDVCSRAPASQQGAAPTIRAGSGDASIVVPAGVEAVRVSAAFSGNAANFAAWLNGRLLINQVLSADKPAHSGLYAANAGDTLAIEASQGVTWTIASERLPQAAPFRFAGTGDSSFRLPSRGSRYTVTASTNATAENFAVWADGALVVNTIIGTDGQVQTYSTTVNMPAGAMVRVIGPTSTWTFVEAP